MPQFDPGQVRRAVEEVLARPEYREAVPTLRDRALAFVADQLGRLIDLLAGGGRGSLIASLVIVAAAAFVAVLGLRFARSVRRDPEVAAAVAAPTGRDAGAWRSEARGHEQAGRWREALRCHYRALLAELAAAGLIEEIPGRTAREYLSAVAETLPAAAEPMAEATGAFELAWYGSRPVGRSQVAALRAAADQVLAARHRPAPATAAAP